MEIVKKLNIPAAFFFDKVIESVQYDVKLATGKNLSERQLKNYSYIKEFSKKSRAQITIEKLERDTAYYFRTSTTRNEYFAKYDILPIDDKTCEVRYSETMKSIGLMQKLNDLAFGLALSYFKRKQFKYMLKAIEQSY